MKRKKELDFILNENLNEVIAYVRKHTLDQVNQEELFENYPETLLKIAEETAICTPVIIKMIVSKKKCWLPILMKKDFFFEEEIVFIRTYPEKVSQYLSMEGEHFPVRTLTPDGEELYHKMWLSNQELPVIQYVWHTQFNEDENGIEVEIENEDEIEQVIVDLKLQ